MTGPPTEEPVVVFTRPGCPFSNRLLRELAVAGIDVELRDIWADPDAAAFVRSAARGNETVPTVVVGGKVFVNPPPTDVIDAARAPGLAT